MHRSRAREHERGSLLARRISPARRCRSRLRTGPDRPDPGRFDPTPSACARAAQQPSNPARWRDGAMASGRAEESGELVPGPAAGCLRLACRVSRTPGPAPPTATPAADRRTAMPPPPRAPGACSSPSAGRRRRFRSGFFRAVLYGPRTAAHGVRGISPLIWRTWAIRSPVFRQIFGVHSFGFVKAFRNFRSDLGHSIFG